MANGRRLPLLLTLLACASAARKAPHNASESFVAALRESPPPRTGDVADCGAPALARIERLAKHLSDDLQSTSKHYRFHGYLGIFADVYNGTKTSFMFRHTCKRASTVRSICEVGFNAGHSAMLMLEAAPAARLVSFDVADSSKPWVARQASRLKQAYGDRFALIVGDSRKTLPAYRRAHEGAACDVAFIDGSKTFEGRLADLRAMHAMASRGATVFFDEVTTRGCVSGHTPLDVCARSTNAGYHEAVRAYHNASSSGWLHVGECVFAAGKRSTDGMCVGRLRSVGEPALHDVR